MSRPEPHPNSRSGVSLRLMEPHAYHSTVGSLITYFMINMSPQRKRSWGWDETELSLEPASQDPLVPQSPRQMPAGNSVVPMILTRVSLLLCFLSPWPQQSIPFPVLCPLKGFFLPLPYNFPQLLPPRHISVMVLNMSQPPQWSWETAVRRD